MQRRIKKSHQLTEGHEGARLYNASRRQRLSQCCATTNHSHSLDCRIEELGKSFTHSFVLAAAPLERMAAPQYFELAVG